MNLLKDFGRGISNYGSAIEFIFKHRLYPFFLVPLLLNLLLFYLGFQFTNSLSTEVINYLSSTWNIGNWDFKGAEFLSHAINFFIYLILKLFFFLLFAFIGGYVVLFLLSPFLAFLSEKTEMILTKGSTPFSIKQLIKDSWRGMRLAIQNFFLEVGLTLFLFFLSFIPIAGLISAPLLFFVSAYFYGFSFMDYTLERKQMSLRQSKRFIQRNKGLALGNGSIFAMVLLIPIIGVGLSGFVAMISTVAATLSLQKKKFSDEI